ncbi:MAG: glycosyltransferase family 4 protein [Parvularcula sp.]|jgi:glycosyltransferase involved in cell wall biosynthesis|nr:glycosyltransferase family 4 protein [Parvularcula sp.]
MGRPDFSSTTLLQVIPKLIGGGAERTTLEVAQAFVEAGGRSLVVSSGGGMVGELEAQGSQHVAMPVESKNPLVISANASALADLIEREGVDLVHARSRAPAWSALKAARRTRRPFVTTYHGVYKAKDGLKRLYNSVMVRADAVIANSAFTAAHIQSEYAGQRYFDPSLVTTIPRGADLSRFDPAALDTQGMPSQASLFGEGLKVVLPGRFTPWKGQEVLIDAASILAREGHRDAFSFLLIGRMDEKPGYVEELRARIKTLGLEGSVRLADATDDMPTLLRAADVVVSASTEPEAFGRVAVEAQAAGRPIIASAHGGALETVIDGETGYLVPPGEAEALAKALLAVNHLGQEGREGMGRRGMAHARGTFTTEAMTAATLAIYARVLADRGERT